MDSTEPVTIKDRLRATMALFLDDSHFDPFLVKAIIALSKNFLKNTTDEDIREAVCRMRDDVIPYILEGVKDENQYPQ